MNYYLIYNTFIQSRINRVLDSSIYTERHHIIPRALGGNNDSNNIITLTAKEHFFAHRLLAKIYGGSMWYAVQRMSHHGYTTSRIYETVRKKCSEYCKSQEFTDILREKSGKKKSFMTPWGFFVSLNHFVEYNDIANVTEYSRSVIYKWLKEELYPNWFYYSESEFDVKPGWVEPSRQPLKEQKKQVNRSKQGKPCYSPIGVFDSLGHMYEEYQLKGYTKSRSWLYSRIKDKANHNYGWL